MPLTLLCLSLSVEGLVSQLTLSLEIVMNFSSSWLREFIDDPFRGHIALVEFLQYLHLNQPSSEDSDVPKRKGKPDVLARNFVSMFNKLLLLSSDFPLHIIKLVTDWMAI